MKISISQKRREQPKLGSTALVPSVAAPAVAATFLARRNRQPLFRST